MDTLQTEESKETAWERNVKIFQNLFKAICLGFQVPRLAIIPYMGSLLRINA